MTTANATPITDAQTSTAPKMVKYPITVFNDGLLNPFPDAAKEKKIVGFHPKSKHSIPTPSKMGITFSAEFLRDLIVFLNNPRGFALMITGETGSGKTTGVLEAGAYLNWPVREYACTGDHEHGSLRGQFQFKSAKPGEPPAMTFVHGALAKAMRNGEILLINEFDMGSPEELAGLNDVLAGRPLVIEENGDEIIYPHPMFRIIATGNSNGGGDETGDYAGVQSQNMATMDRFRVIKKPYMSTDEEIAVIEKATDGKIPTAIAAQMVEVAQSFRSLYLQKQLSRTMSTRSLVHWAFLMVDYNGAQNANGDSIIISYTVQRCFMNHLRSDEVDAAKRIVSDQFADGVQWD